MDKYTVFRSVLIFLLLCYGKKFVDANERNQPGSISQPNSGIIPPQFVRRNESIPLNQSTGFHQQSAPNQGVQQGSQNFTEIKINRTARCKSINLISLNLDIWRSTNEVNYSLQDGTHKFICKEGFLINEVTKDNTVVWVPKTSAYAYGMVFIENYEGRPKLTALIDDDDFGQPQNFQPPPQPAQVQQPRPQARPAQPAQFQQPQARPAQPQHPQGQQQQLFHQQPPQHTVQEVFHTPMPSQENPVPDSDIALNDIFIVDRNDSPGSADSDDVEVRRGNSDSSYVSENYGIDNETSDMEFLNHSPKRRPASSDGSYNGNGRGRNYEEFTIGSQGEPLYSSGYSDGSDRSRGRRSRIPRPSKHGPVTSEVKNIIVLDVGIGDNLGYDMIENPNNVIFEAKQNFLFNKVKNGNQVVWEPKNPGDYANKVLVKIEKDNKLSYEVFIHEEPVEDDGDVEAIPVHVSKRQDHPPVHPHVQPHVQPQHAQSQTFAPDVNILTLDSRGTLRVNDFNHFMLTRHLNILKYQFIIDAKCVEVKYLRETVWKAEQHFPLSVAFNRSDNTFVIDFGTAYVHCKKTGNTWTNATHQYSAGNDQLGVKYNQSYPRDVGNAVEPKSDVTPLAHKATAIVDIDTRKSANEFEFSKKSDDCGTYTPKHNFIFKVVKGSVTRIGGKVDIWHPESEDEYVTKVVIDGVSFNAKVNNATLFLANGNIKHFTILKKEWVEIDPTVILNIESKKTTCEFDVFAEGHIKTFTPKGHFLFQGIKQSVGSSCTRADIDIWETNDPLEFGTKVVVVTSKQSEKYVAMFLLNRTFKLFYKSGKNSMWKDESDIPSTVSNLKLLGVDISDDKYYGIRKGQKKGTRVSELSVTEGTGDPSLGGDRIQVVHGSLDGHLPGDPNANYTAPNLRNMTQASEPVQFTRRSAGPSGPVSTQETVRKVVVEHVPCDPREIVQSEESTVTYRDSGTSMSEDSDYEHHSGHSDWIPLKR